MQEVLKEKIHQALNALDLEGVAVELEYPADMAHGDFATNAAMVAAKKAGENPRVLAENIIAELGTIEGVSKIEPAGPGFINFTLSREYIAQVVHGVDAEFGKNEVFKNKQVVVEYGQPNIFKPFHIGHLMSISVGEAISRLIEYSGAHVVRFNYQGDIGLHVAKGVWGLVKIGGSPEDVTALGAAYVAGNEAYENDPDAKEEIDALNKKLYEEDLTQNEVYQKGRKASLDAFEGIYNALGTRYDHYAFETETASVGLDMVQKGLSTGVFEESDGATVYKGEKVGAHTRVFITSKGLPTYETKELGLAKVKYDIVPYDLNITTVAVEQDTFFKVVRGALYELWPEMEGVYTHATFGMMQLVSGKMSSRKGNIISGEGLITDMRSAVEEQTAERDLGSEKDAIVNAVAVAAIKYGILKQAKSKNITFDPEKALSFDGDSGPYLQYSYVRAQSVLEKADGKDGALDDAASGPEDISEMERLLLRFPDMVERAAREYEPHYVTNYLTELASAFNSWYTANRIIGSEHEAYYLSVVRAFAHTMENGLWLLGIEAPERM